MTTDTNTQEPEIVCSFKASESEDGDCFSNGTILAFPVGMTLAAIGEWIAGEFPSYRCQHAHDCCGHFYPSSPDWALVSGPEWHDEYGQTVIVRQVFSQNI